MKDCNTMHKYWEDKYKEQSEVIIDDQMRELPFLAFDGDRDLRFISLPDSVTKICFRAFKDCTALEKIIIPSTVTSIGNNAFENCEKLKAVELAQNLTRYAEEFSLTANPLNTSEFPSG
ncbi:leucine-rich repeat domain-containing protein [Ruminococcus sp.]